MTTNDKELAQVLLAINTTLTQQQALQTQAQKNGCISNTLKILAVMFVFMCAIVSLVTLALVSLAENTADTATATTNQRAVADTQHTQPLNNIHYIAGSQLHGNGVGNITLGEPFDMYYYGRDYVRPHGTPIYAPYDGKITYQANIGGNTPQLTISNDKGEKVHIMHLDVEVTSGAVKQGDLLGFTAANGAYSNNVPHEHVSYYIDGKLSDWETSSYSYETSKTITTNTGDSYYGELRDCSLGTCKLSGFTPQNKDGTFNEGSVNCDGDCTMTASGNATVDLLTSGKCYVAAPSDVPFNTVISIDGVGDCIVADRGGYINHLYEGESDVACISALSKGNMQACGGATTAITEYYWLDIISYGD